MRRRLLKIILPCTGQCAFDHCISVCNVKDIKEERRNQEPKVEVFLRVRKEGVVTRREAKKERALSTKGMWA